MGRRSERPAVRGVVVRIVGINLAGVAVVSLLPVSQPEAGEEFYGGWGLPLLLGYLAVALTTLSALGVPRVRRAVVWRDEGRRPTERERQALLGLPSLAVRLTFAGWTAGAPAFCLWTAAIGGVAIEVLDTALRAVIAATTVAAICYLVVERAVRAFVADAFDDAPGAVPRRVGLRGRLAALWLLGSAVPLAVVGLAFLGRDAAARAELIDDVWLFVVLSLGISSLATVILGRSIIEPIDRVRVGLERLQQGDLQAQVAVDDGTEIGRLQDGFNRMVHGLRERERLRDLFGRHVGLEVASHAIESAAWSDGVRQEASTIFIDVVGSTAMATQREPEEVVVILNALFAVVVEAVAAEGGWINKFEGDAALCIFGPPAGQADHAARALRAALRLRDGVRAVARVHPGLDAGIGVSSGLVVAGNIGAADRYEYTVIGDPVNQAARITDLAKRSPERVLVAASTIDAAAPAPGTWVEVGSSVLRGRSTPTTLFAPAGR
jgi:adenylate cyclase